MANADRRLGFKTVLQDNVDTWSLRVGRQRTRDRFRAAAWYYVTPSVAGAPFLFRHLHVQGVGQILSGVAVFTGLLFALLVLMFNTGITLRKDADSLASAHDVRRTISDLRANITYTVFVAVALAVTLILAAALTPASHALGWGWTPPLVWLFVHLGLNLLTILQRFRTAYNYLSR